MRVKIIPNQEFLDLGYRYKPGKVYDVLEEKAKYFVKYGWAERAEHGKAHKH